MLIGKEYQARNNPRVRKNGLIPGDKGRVAFVDSEAISIEFMNYKKLKIPKGLFGANFEQTSLSSGNPAYNNGKHFDEEFT